MPHLIPCPQCHRQLRLMDDILGRLVQCPGCQATFTAALPPPAPPPVAEVIPLTREQMLDPPETPPPPRRRRSSRRRDDWDDRDDYLFDDEDDPDYRRSARHSGAATTTLVLGILSLVLCWAPIVGLVLGVIAWSTAASTLPQLHSRRTDPSIRSKLVTGMICGIIGNVLSVLACAGACMLRLARL
jgi:hypothetical protein